MALAQFNEWEKGNVLNEAERETIGSLSSYLLKPACEKIVKQSPVKEDQELRLKTSPQFLAWFQEIQAEMEKGQDDVFRSFLREQQLEKSRLLEVVKKLEQQQTLVEKLLGNLQLVNNKTEGLQNACEQLLNEQKHLVGVIEDISQKMLYFEELEPIAQALNQPGDVLVKDPRFAGMLAKLDQCLSFIYEHV